MWCSRGQNSGKGTCWAIIIHQYLPIPQTDRHRGSYLYGNNRHLDCWIEHCIFKVRTTLCGILWSQNRFNWQRHILRSINTGFKMSSSNINIDDHSDPIIRTAVKQINELTALRDTGELTQSEYEELCRNTLQLDEIQQSMVSLDRKQTIADTFQQIFTIIGIAKLF